MGGMIPGHCLSDASKALFKQLGVSDLEMAAYAAESIKPYRPYPNNNPKAAIGATKAPLHLVPPALMIGAAEAMADGARKYGPYNFRDSGIAASVYMGAIERHLFSWWDGEDCTRDSKIHHLKAIAADIGLMLDAMAKGTFVDDRPTSGGAADLLEDWEVRQKQKEIVKND